MPVKRFSFCCIHWNISDPFYFFPLEGEHYALLYCGFFENNSITAKKVNWCFCSVNRFVHGKLLHLNNIWARCFGQVILMCCEYNERFSSFYREWFFFLLYFNDTIGTRREKKPFACHKSSPNISNTKENHNNNGSFYVHSFLVRSGIYIVLWLLFDLDT